METFSPAPVEDENGFEVDIVVCADPPNEPILPSVAEPELNMLVKFINSFRSNSKRIKGGEEI